MFHFKFECKNTLNDQLLEHVSVELEDVEGEWVAETTISIDSLPYGEPKQAYTLFSFPDSGFWIFIG